MDGYGHHSYFPPGGKKPARVNSNYGDPMPASHYQRALHGDAPTFSPATNLPYNDNPAVTSQAPPLDTGAAASPIFGESPAPMTPSAAHTAPNLHGLGAEDSQNDFFYDDDELFQAMLDNNPDLKRIYDEIPDLAEAEQPFQTHGSGARNAPQHGQHSPFTFVPHPSYSQQRLSDQRGGYGEQQGYGPQQGQTQGQDYVSGHDATYRTMGLATEDQSYPAPLRQSTHTPQQQHVGSQAADAALATLRNGANDAPVARSQPPVLASPNFPRAIHSSAAAPQAPTGSIVISSQPQAQQPFTQIAGNPSLRALPNLPLLNTAPLNDQQSFQLAKEQIAPRPSQAIPTNQPSLAFYAGRAPARLRNGIANPKQENANYFSEYTAEELLAGVMHPDDVCGTIVIRLGMQYSGKELRALVGGLYPLHGITKPVPDANSFTKRITLAVLAKQEGDKAARDAEVQYIKRSRKAFKNTGRIAVPRLSPVELRAVAAQAAAQAAAVAAIAATTVQARDVVSNHDTHSMPSAADTRGSQASSSNRQGPAVQPTGSGVTRTLPTAQTTLQPAWSVWKRKHSKDGESNDERAAKRSKAVDDAYAEENIHPMARAMASR
ncbi:Hypothetical predicted protein [Lecanosticta acicola]|uniref:Uncharacterized protein n=1 Tax=Lecanosticta acicola TaxID=111012 RepID=A0AAI8YX55_9PEZI|nr:Hypothetical predicted protein [Lecanosticta acicola]